MEPNRAMKNIVFTIIFMPLLFATAIARSQTIDSVDVLDYDLTIDLSNEAPFAGKAEITLQLTQPLTTMSLQLIGTVDSMFVNTTKVQNPLLDAIPVAGITPNTPFTITVHYHGRGYVESHGWGGFHFDHDMSYNLGVAFNENPHVIGRVMFPCRDNFTDKATYTIRLTTKTGWTSECGGIKQSCHIDTAGREHSVWRIDNPISTYLVSASQANFKKIHKTTAGYPLTLAFTTQDSANVAATFALLDSVVPMFERCFGPYRWGRIGYIATEKGSMEHVNNIALARNFMAAPTNSRGQSTIAHELAHAWFGNLVTCRTEADMWFNEGGASFCSEVARQSTHGREAATQYYQENLANVILTTHTTDGSYLPLSPMPHSLTYGSTTYDKGALVWHSLRGYLGETIFYNALIHLMRDKAFSTVDAFEVRDSLMSYTGVDLTDFFDFHVFSPGFVDNHIELDGDTLHIHQQTIGHNGVVASNIVPVRFVSGDGQYVDRRYFTSTKDTAVCIAELPFSPIYCLLDPECSVSDAATHASLTLHDESQTTCSVAYVIVRNPTLHNSIQVHIDHHFAPPLGLDTISGVIRTANRYWTINGDFDHTSGVGGRFLYSRTSGLDQGFYDNSATLDSVVLFYRSSSHDGWHIVSRQHSSNANGYFSATMLPGEYTLAVVDPSSQLSITDHQLPSTNCSLFPNPLHRGEALSITIPNSNTFSVTIFDCTGKKVWSKNVCRNRKKLHPHLHPGTYMVIIKNNFVSLHSKLIQL